MIERVENFTSAFEGKYLWFLLLSFTMLVSISNWYDVRLISICGFALSPGSLTYPITFLISDSITEVYGFKKARLGIWAALFFNVIFLIFGQIVTHLPSPGYATDNVAFDKLLGMNFWIVCGSFISFLLAEPLNSYLISKLKIIFKGQYVGIRFVGSTIIASFFDSIIFIFIAFYTSFSIPHLLQLAINIWVTKVLIEVLFLPFSIRITTWLKKKEKLDIYDFETRFNLFSLDADYQSKNNLYKN